MLACSDIALNAQKVKQFSNGENLQHISYIINDELIIDCCGSRPSIKQTA